MGGDGGLHHPLQRSSEQRVFHWFSACPVPPYLATITTILCPPVPLTSPPSRLPSSTPLRLDTPNTTTHLCHCRGIHRHDQEEGHHRLPAKHLRPSGATGGPEAAGGRVAPANVQLGDEGRIDEGAKDGAQDLNWGGDKGGMTYECVRVGGGTQRVNRQGMQPDG